MYNFTFHRPTTVRQAAGLLARNPNPSEAEIREQLEGNLCRCTGYQNIVAAVRQAAQEMQGSQAAPVTAGATASAE